MLFEHSTAEVGEAERQEVSWRGRGDPLPISSDPRVIRGSMALAKKVPREMTRKAGSYL